MSDIVRDEAFVAMARWEDLESAVLFSQLGTLLGVEKSAVLVALEGRIIDRCFHRASKEDGSVLDELLAFGR